MRWLLLLILIVTAYSCEIPRDPRGTMDKIKNTHYIKAGYIENKPWVFTRNGQPSGVEVRIINEIARHLSARVIWRQGSPQELLAALKNGELDVVTAGFWDDSRLEDYAALTNPYFTDSVCIGVPEAIIRPQIEKLYVGVKDGSQAPYYLKKLGAKPIRVAQLSAYDGPVAASISQLRSLGLKVFSDALLYKVDHVIAVIPGENAWLMYIENFLTNNESLINKWVAEGTFE